MVKNIYCGYNLKYAEKQLINELAMKEFEKPVYKRCHVFQLVEKVKNKNLR